MVGPRIATLPSDEYAGGDFLREEPEGGLPGTLGSYAPILVPILLIAAQSVSRLFLDEDNLVRAGLAYIGWPVMALSIGVWLAYRNIRTPEHRKAATNAWVEDGLRVSAMILVVTGLGGSLSEILKGTPAVEAIAGFFAAYGLPSILLPFVIGIIGNMITGSTTVWRDYRGIPGGTHAVDARTFTGGGHARRGQRLGDHQVRQLQLLLGVHVAEPAPGERRHPGLRRSEPRWRYRRLPGGVRDVVAGADLTGPGMLADANRTDRPRSNPNTSGERIDKPSFEQLDRVNPYQ